MMESGREPVYTSLGTVVSGPISRCLKQGIIFHMPKTLKSSLAS